MEFTELESKNKENAPPATKKTKENQNSPPIPHPHGRFGSVLLLLAPSFTITTPVVNNSDDLRGLITLYSRHRLNLTFCSINAFRVYRFDPPRASRANSLRDRDMHFQMEKSISNYSRCSHLISLSFSMPLSHSSSLYLSPSLSLSTAGRKLSPIVYSSIGG